MSNKPWESDPVVSPNAKASEKMPWDSDPIATPKDLMGLPQSSVTVSQPSAPTPVGSTKVADVLQKSIFSPIDAIMPGSKMAEEPSTFVGSLAKGVKSLGDIPDQLKLASLMELISANQEKYGKNFENAPAKEQADLWNTVTSANKIISNLKSTEEDFKAIEAKYGKDPLAKKLDKLEQTPEFQSAGKWEQTGLVGKEYLKNITDFPEYAINVGLSSLPQSIAMAVAAKVGMKAGPSAAMVAGGGSSALMEYGQEYVDLREQGYTHEEANNKAMVKSAVIGLFDAASLKSAGHLAKELFEDTAKKAWKETVKDVSKEVPKQAFYGGAGEALGSVASNQPVNPRAVLEEAIGELAGAPAEVAATYQGKKAEIENAGVPPVVPPTPKAPKPPKAATPETVAAGLVNEEDLEAPAAPPVISAPVTKTEETVSPETRTRAEMRVDQLIADAEKTGNINVREMNKLARELEIEPDKDPMKTAFAILDAIKPNEAVAPVETPNLPHTVEQILDRGQPVDTKQEAEKAHSDGDFVYAFHEQDLAHPKLIKDVDQMKGYTADQLLVVPKEEAKNAEQEKPTAEEKPSEEKPAKEARAAEVPVEEKPVSETKAAAEEVKPEAEEKTQAQINQERQAAKKAAATQTEEEKIVDAIQTMAYDKKGTPIRVTANDFIEKHGKKMFDRAVEMDLLDNEPGEGRLFPSNNYAYTVVQKYYGPDGKKLKQPNVAPVAAPTVAPENLSPEAKAKQDLEDALGDLAWLATKPTRMNMMPEDEQRLMPILTRLMDAAFRMGYHKFKAAAKFVRDMIREKFGKDVADKIKLNHLQGAYIGMSGNYPEASKNKEVVEVEHLDELEAEAKAEEPTGTVDLNTTEGKFHIAQAISKHFMGGLGFKDINEARRFIADLTGQKIEAGTMAAKQADEAVEVGVVLAAQNIAHKNRKPSEIYDGLVNLYNRQPNLAVRSSTSVREQAYSTPAPLAYVASQLAGITDKTTVYEPTGGNGMLLIGANPNNVTVNELNTSRYEMLKKVLPGATVANKNALSYDPDLSDVIIANPPFGSTGQEYSFFNGLIKTREIDHAIAYTALGRMPANGRAVLILGGVRAEGEDAKREGYRQKAKREFYYNLYKDYNVVDHFSVAGDMYSKQGASYPVDVIVIDGKGQSQRALPAAELPQQITSYEELKEKLNEPSVVSRENVSPTRTNVSERTAGEPKPEPVGERPSGQGREAGAEGERPTEGGRRGVSENGVGKRGQPEPAGAGVSAGQPGLANEPERGINRGPVPSKGGEQQPSGRKGVAGNEPSPVGGPSVVSGTRVESGLKDRRGQETETGHQVAYQPHSQAASVGTLVPKAMAESIDNSITEVEREVGDVDEYVAEALHMDPETLREKFSAEQIDALVLAIRNAEAGKGFIIGDQTGIGKGRVVAAMIKYAIENDKVPIFVTEKPNLYSDMIRDLDDIGMTKELGLDTAKPRIFITNSSESIPYTLLRTVNGEVTENNLTLKAPKTGKALDEMMKGMQEKESLGDYKVIFTTYSQLQAVKKNETERQRFIKSFGLGNYMIFDESHNAGGAGETQARSKEQRESQKEGKSLATGRAAFVRDLVDNAFGTFFSSATYAKRPDVMDLYSSTDMKLAVDNINELADAIKLGGIPMQQIVANMLTKVGQYIRRERTFAGVSYQTQETKVDKQTAENMATSMRDILAFSRSKEAVVKEMQKEFDKSGGRASIEGEKTQIQSANFGAIMHNLIDQMLLSLKAQDSIKHAVESLKNGEKVVMTVSNTMGSFLQSYANEMGINVGDPVNLTFKDLYLRYLEKQRMLKIKGPNGEQQYRMTDQDLGPERLAAYNQIKTFIENAGFGSAPISPIDYMHNELRKAGYKTEEITGRKVTLNYESGTPILTSRSANIKQRVGAVRAFNNGTADVIILNQAGSTGLSLHASSSFKDQRKRHMIIVQPEKNIDTHMQMLGRVHRTGQVVAPAYSQMMADIPAEMRPAAVLLKKMASLNANTTASRKSAVTAEGAVDFMNDYGGQIAQEYLRDNPEVHEAIGGKKVVDLIEDPTDAKEDDIRRLTGYIPILPIKEQEEIYKDLIDRYNDLVERENSMGTNKLEAKAVDLDAETLSAVPITPDKGDPSLFAQPAYMEKVDVKRTVKPYTKQEVQEMVSENLEGGTQRQKVDKLMDGVRERAAEYGRKQIENLKEKGADEVRIDAAKGQLNLQYQHIKSILENYAVGQPISIKNNQGIFVYGVVTDLENKKKTANPVAGSDWKMHIALANGDAKAITINFSQIGSIYQLNQENYINWYNPDTQQAENIPLKDLFDKGANVRREKRWMVTGNILAGFASDAVKNQGQIMSYTKADGTTGQGILMPRTYDFEKAAREAPIRLRSAADAMRFMNEVNGVITSADNVLRITKSSYGNQYQFNVPSSKKEGGTYFLDRGLTDIFGDFYKSGNTMYARGNEQQAAKAIDFILNERGDTLIASSPRDKAREMFAPPKATVTPSVMYQPKVPPVYMITDNPGGNWLEHKRQLSREDGRKSSGVPYRFGSATAYFRTKEGVTNSPVRKMLVPVNILAKMQGINDEQQNVRTEDFISLENYMNKVNHLPFEKDGKTHYTPYINVYQDGTPYVNEGNHRIMVAKALGWEYLPVAIDYYNGAESENGILSPAKAIEYDRKAHEDGFTLTNYAHIPKLNPSVIPKNLREQIAQIHKVKTDELARVRRGITKIKREVIKGETTINTQRELTYLDQLAKELAADKKMTAEKKITPEAFMARALNEYNKGNISKDVLDVIQYIYRQSPAILTGLRLSVKQAPQNAAYTAAGVFNNLERIVRLYKESGAVNPGTIRHELMHTLEQMMDPQTQQAIIESWRAALEKAIKKNTDEVSQKYFMAVMDYVNDPSEKNFEKAMELLPSQDMYQYINPSEFWAVNAEKLFGTRMGTPWGRYVNAIRQVFEAMKKLFGFNNTHSVYKAFNDLIKGETPRTHKTMLVDLISSGPYKTKFLYSVEKTDELLAKHNRNDAPIHTSNGVMDKFLGGAQEAKNIGAKMVESPRLAVNNMVGNLDRAVLATRIKTTDFTAGLTAADAARYGRMLEDSEGRAVASVAMNQALKATRIGTQVIMLGKLVFDNTNQMFHAVQDKFSMANILTLKHQLEKEIGVQRAANVIQAYFEAKRSRSIVDEYLKREGELEMLRTEQMDPRTSPDRQLLLLDKIADAEQDFKNIGIALQKVNMSDEAIDDFSKLDKQYPALREMMNNWNAVNKNMIDMMEQSRMISKQRADTLRDIEDYVPWQRIMDDQTDVHTPIYSSKGVKNVAREHRFKEGKVDLDIDDIVDNMLHNVMVTTRNAIKNYAANRIAQEYGTRNENGKLKVFPKEDPARGIVKILINGRKVNIQIADPLIAQSVIGIENIQIPMNEIMAYFANGLRRSITFSGVFQLKQLFMDAPTAAIVTGVKNPVALFGGVFGSFAKGLTQKDDVVELLKSYGIGGYHSGARTAEHQYKQEIGLLNKSAFARVTSILDQIADASDFAQRRAVYVRVMKETGGFPSGGDQRKAILAATNVIDFDKRGMGRTAQFLNRTIAFMNAYAQQIDVLTQALAEPIAGGVEKLTGQKVTSISGGLRGLDRQQAMTRLAIASGLLASTCLLYAFAIGDDDEYKKMDDQTKMRNFVIPRSMMKTIGYDHTLLIPMHTSASYFFKSIPEMLYNKITKEGTKDAIDNARLRKALKEGAVDALLGPLGSGPVPTAIKPFAEIALNHDFYTGGNVTPQSMKDLAAFRQYNGSTSELGKWISYASGLGSQEHRMLSPIQADHVMRGLGGSVAAAAMWGSNLFSGHKASPEERNNPLYGSFVAPEVPRGREDLFYDLKTRSDTAMGTFKDLIKKGHKEEAQQWLKDHEGEIKASGFTAGAGKALIDINAEIRRIEDLPANRLSPEEKRQQINFYKKKKEEILDQTIKFRLSAGL